MAYCGVSKVSTVGFRHSLGRFYSHCPYNGYPVQVREVSRPNLDSLEEENERSCSEILLLILRQTQKHVRELLFQK